MSSTERAPEPTMEEILSSIRRIITDDDKVEAGAEAPEAAQAPQAQQGEVSDVEADSQIIDDIARVLSGGATEVDEEEEILDLTSELGGLELVEVVEEVTLVEELELVEEVEILEVDAPAPEFVAEAEVPAEPAPFYPSAEEAPLEMGLEMEMVPQAEVPQAPVEEAPPLASQEAASALERAIAALKAGQVPTSSSQAEPMQFQATPNLAAVPGLEPMPEATVAPEFTPEPIPMATPMEAPEPEAETHPEFEAQSEGETAVEADFEADFDEQPDVAPTIEVVADAELESVMVEVEETIITEALVAFEAPEGETGKSPFWPSEAAAPEEVAEPEPAPAFVPEPDVEPEAVPVAAFVNGALGSDDAAKTLEDSVKDMLRPMLRQWLDDNMPRMVKDQLGDDVTPGQQD